MKTCGILAMAILLSFSCSGQKKDIEKNVPKTNLEKQIEQPKGSWKVDKEFDENGNLIRYDSIYSWSSGNAFDALTNVERDSLMQSYKSRFFKNFSRFRNQGFEDFFSQDSLFSKQFFNDDFFGSDFGNDFMDIDKFNQQMIERQKQFLEKYKLEFIKPKEEH
ncbi:hypothetical protein [Gelatiniphilus marinus]|uniref:Lipoprotein n=1 Tax=Gelatiniphilus marinus TaxID=1759464 RepID=A0ABW5JRE3_9FLAO